MSSGPKWLSLVAKPLGCCPTISRSQLMHRYKRLHSYMSHRVMYTSQENPNSTLNINHFLPTHPQPFQSNIYKLFIKSHRSDPTFFNQNLVGKLAERSSRCIMFIKHGYRPVFVSHCIHNIAYSLFLLASFASQLQTRCSSEVRAGEVNAPWSPAGREQPPPHRRTSHDSWRY